MFQRSLHAGSSKRFLKLIRIIQLLVVLFLFTSYLVWSRNTIINDRLNYNKLTNEVVENVGKDLKYTALYRNEKYLPQNLKYILLWSLPEYEPFKILYPGQKTFITHNCIQINCYVTDNKRFFGDNLTKFDVIAFNGRDSKIYKNSGTNNNLKEYFPSVRAPHQKYIYFNQESAANYPVPSKDFDGFFNWTATYRLDSDLMFNYFWIINSRGEVVGPKIDMEWVKNMDDVDDEFKTKLKSKHLAAAWFVSNCKSRSNRMDLVHKLQKKLDKYDLRVDIFGACGTLECPHDRQHHCNLILKNEYYFYMSLENSFAEDYVTEKLLNALNNDVVPIVYGGANYSRFLPPGSYIDARSMSVEQLADLMDHLMKHPEVYQQYFRWKKYYTYINDPSRSICSLCQALYEPRFTQYSSCDNFSKWWTTKVT